MPSWIGPWEIAIVVIIALLIFGPSRLPGLGSSMGKSISGFKKGLKESTEEFQAAVRGDDTETPASAEAHVATTTIASAAAPVIVAKQPAMAAAAPVTAAPLTAAPAKQPVIAATTVESPSAD
jgi:sec-independent protein translocase protein TatA